MSSLRDKYAQRVEASPLSSQIKDAEEKMSHGNGGINWLKIQEGFNDFRLFPSIDEESNFIQLKHTHRLPIEEEDRDGNLVIKERKPIFNSRTHGGTPKDVIDEYIAFYERREIDKIKKMDISKQDFGKKVKEVMKPIRYFKTGIAGEFKWTGYGGIISWNEDGDAPSSIEKGVFEFPYSVGKKMDSLAAAQDRRAKVTVTNPFTNIDTGAVLVLEYDSKKDPNDKYAVSLDNEVSIPWSEEDLKWLEDQSPLAERYVGSYRRLDFNMAIEGLTRFDAKHNFGIMADPTFQTIVKEISGYYPADVNEPMIIRAGSKAEKAKEETKDPFDGAEVKEEAPAAKRRRAASSTAPAAEKAAPIVKQQTKPMVDPAIFDNDKDKLSLMDRSEILAYIQTNGLNILVTSEHTEDMIRGFIRTEEKLLKAEAAAESQGSDYIPFEEVSPSKIEAEHSTEGIHDEENHEPAPVDETPEVSRRSRRGVQNKIADAF
tara:strand:- start:52682 stop:54142 length:1461 start_codon:yes stop_codon:yes gene_type:complete